MAGGRVEVSKKDMLKLPLHLLPLFLSLSSTAHLTMVAQIILVRSRAGIIAASS